jgi:phosphoribosyl-AMP cyclohydrolase
MDVEMFRDVKFDEKGLVPVIVQDAETKEVLMLAYANQDALKLTLQTGKAHYWSRSRGKIWMKGETSGNFQNVIEVRIDCDGDTLLYIVRQKGVACHTGSYSCFFRKLGESRKPGDEAEESRINDKKAEKPVEGF